MTMHEHRLSSECTHLRAEMWPERVRAQITTAPARGHAPLGMLRTQGWARRGADILPAGQSGPAPRSAGRDLDPQRAAAPVVERGVVDRAGGEDEDQVSLGPEGDRVARP